MVCPYCKKIITVKGRYHAGFSNQGFLYCDKDSTVLVFDSYGRYYTKLIPNKPPWTLTGKEKELIESHLNQCPCGGSFGFSSKPKCPHCRRELPGLMDTIYYVILDKTVNGDNKSAWKNSP